MGWQLGLVLVCTIAASAQQPVPQQVVPRVAATPTVLPTLPDVPAISAYTPPGRDDGYRDAGAAAFALQSPTGLDTPHYFGPYRRAKVPALFAGNGDRLRSLVRDGKLYLSEKDAIALAIENNLDVEIERYNLVLADTDRRRAAGGGNLRGIDYTIQEPPNGVGGPGSPLLNTTAANPNPTTPTVTDLTSLNATTQVQVNLSRQLDRNGAPLRPGPRCRCSIPTLFLSAGYLRRSNTVTLASTTGSNRGKWRRLGPAPGQARVRPNAAAGVRLPVCANLSYLQGFRTGAQLGGDGANNDSKVIYGSNSDAPIRFLAAEHFRHADAAAAARLWLRSTCATSGSRTRTARCRVCCLSSRCLKRCMATTRIYYDLVSLGENVGVKQEALRAARKLQEDDQAQVDFGTLAHRSNWCAQRH